MQVFLLFFKVSLLQRIEQTGRMEANTKKSYVSDDDATYLLLSKDAINTKKANERPHISEGEQLWRCQIFVSLLCDR